MKLVLIAEVCKVVGGGTPKTSVSEYWSGEIVWITPKDLGKLKGFQISDSSKKISEKGLEKSSAKILPVGSVVLSSRAPIGYVGIANVPLATNQGCRSFVCNEQKIYNKYLYYFLIKNTDHLNSLGGGSTFKEISGTKLKEIEIPLPPLVEQKRIVAKLDAELAKVKKMQTLREEALSETAQMLPARLREIFEEGKQEGWEEKKLGEICEINPSKSEIRDLPDSTKVSFVRMSNVSEISQRIVVQTDETLGKVKKGYTYFRNNDVLFAKITPCMENGKMAIVNLNHEIGFGSTEFHVIRAGEKVLPEFIFHIVRSKKFRNEAEKRMTGSAGQKRVPKNFLENYNISLPSLAEQKKIVTELDALSEKVNHLRTLGTAQLSDLKALEQALLKEAFEMEI